METIPVRSTSLAVDTYGSGPPVVLAAGTGMPALVWEVCGFVEGLVAAGYQVVTYSARGVAPSGARTAPYTIEEMARDLAELIEGLALGLCTVIGYSLGGFQAELIARTRPDHGQWLAAREWTRDVERMERLAEIDVPVLALAFEQDLKFPPSGARLAASAIPRGEAVEIVGAAHGGLLTHTQEKLETVLSFLGSGAAEP